VKERKRFWVELAELAMEQVSNGSGGEAGRRHPSRGGER